MNQLLTTAGGSGCDRIGQTGTVRNYECLIALGQIFASEIADECVTVRELEVAPDHHVTLETGPRSGDSEGPLFTSGKGGRV